MKLLTTMKKQTKTGKVTVQDNEHAGAVWITPEEPCVLAVQQVWTGFYRYGQLDTAKIETRMAGVKDRIQVLTQMRPGDILYGRIVVQQGLSDENGGHLLIDSAGEEIQYHGCPVYINCFYTEDDSISDVILD